MLRITRRDFLKYCSIAAGALGLSATTMLKLDKAMARSYATGGLPVLWISGAACTGCTMTLTDSRFYTTVDDLLLNTLDLRYLDTIMATAGSYIDHVEWSGANSIEEAQSVYQGEVPYVLVVEGAIPVKSPSGTSGTNNGEYCNIGDLVGDNNETMLNVTRKLASRALAVIGVGACASWGGVPGARGNVTDARGLLFKGTQRNKGALNDTTLGAAISTPVINIPGCPPHPDWIVGTIAHIVSTLGSGLADAIPSLDILHRPVDYGYKTYQCNAGPCPWRYNNISQRANNNNNALVSEPDYNDRWPQGDSRQLGREKWTTQAVGCLGILGCKGRKTKADCSSRRWNTDVAEEYGVNWCVGSRGNCHGCTEPTFPDKVGKFYTFA